MLLCLTSSFVPVKLLQTLEVSTIKQTGFKYPAFILDLRESFFLIKTELGKGRKVGIGGTHKKMNVQCYHIVHVPVQKAVTA